jgi:DNA-binding Lrp family transcriptional regulator
MRQRSRQLVAFCRDRSTNSAMALQESGDRRHTVPMELDAIDRRILRALQRDGRLQNVDLAQEVGLSPSPCLRRVRRLEEAGVIERYAAMLDAAKIGFGMTIFARVWLTGQDQDTVSAFVTAIRALPQVAECYLMAGDCDFLIRVLVRDLDAYRRFQVEHLARIPGVRSIKTDISMQTVKPSGALPIQP